VLNAARIAPSANNRQPWQYVMVQEVKTINKIALLANEQMFIAKAPVVIVLCGRKYVNPHSWLGESIYVLEAAISLDHLVLAARNEGLGTCWVGAFDRKGTEEFLGIPPEFPPIMITPLGYPREETAFRPIRGRKSLEEICFWERFGQKSIS